MKSSYKKRKGSSGQGYAKRSNVQQTNTRKTVQQMKKLNDRCACTRQLSHNLTSANAGFAGTVVPVPSIPGTDSGQSNSDQLISLKQGDFAYNRHGNRALIKKVRIRGHIRRAADNTRVLIGSDNVYGVGYKCRLIVASVKGTWPATGGTAGQKIIDPSFSALLNIYAFRQEDTLSDVKVYHDKVYDLSNKDAAQHTTVLDATEFATPRVDASFDISFNMNQLLEFSGDNEFPTNEALYMFAVVDHVPGAGINNIAAGVFATVKYTFEC